MFVCMHYCFVCVLQDCVVYLCGTKFDLVEENKKMRKVEIAVVKDYADGTCTPGVWEWD